MTFELLFNRFVSRPAKHLFGNAALLEYPHEYLDALCGRAVNHHYGSWDDIYKRIGSKKPEYDLWLEKYAGLLQDSKDVPIIDLGCGYGNDTLFLHERGHRVISCDLSMEALERLEHFIDRPVIKHFDMLAGLPFAEGAAKVIIADLSIHYFPWEDTERLVEEIGRVLAADGYLLCRVNSVKNMGSASGARTTRTTIENNYYDFGGRKKRYFDKDHMERLFGTWDIRYMHEYTLERFGSTKVLWEIAVQKPT